jgi:hypothetical protein
VFGVLGDRDPIIDSIELDKVVSSRGRVVGDIGDVIGGEIGIQVGDEIGGGIGMVGVLGWVGGGRPNPELLMV